MRITVLGCRGSIPAPGADRTEFGGETSCYRVEAAGETLFLDAGTGLRHAQTGEGTVRILLSHWHMDHVMGLTMFSGLVRPGKLVEIHGPREIGMDMTARLDRLISPPLWPLRLADYPAEVRCLERDFPAQVGFFRVRAMASNHPGGSRIYRIEAEGKSLVYATDFEHTEEKLRELAAFAAGADLILYDGQYTEEEYPARRGFGHSVARMGLRVLRESGARELRIIHHDPDHTDGMLREMEKETGARFARQGEEILL